MDILNEIHPGLASVHKYIDCKNDLSDKWAQVESIEQQLNETTIASEEANVSFKKILKTSQASTTTNFIQLKEKQCLLLKHIETCKSQLEKLKIQCADKKRSIILESDLSIKREEDLGKRQLETVKNEIQKRKMDHNLKVGRLNNELAVSQAATDLEQDELETLLRRELIDLSTKIRRQRNINEDLKTEINDLKRRQQETPIQESNLQNELNFFQLESLDDMFQNNIDKEDTTEQRQNVFQAYEHNITKEMRINRDINNWQKPHHSNQTSYSKYQPLPITRTDASKAATSTQINAYHPNINIEENFMQSNKNNYYNPYNRKQKQTGHNSKQNVEQLPATSCSANPSNVGQKNQIATKRPQVGRKVVENELKLLSSKQTAIGNVNSSKTPAKRRRLFDKDNLDYLDSLNMDLDNSD